MFGVGSITKHGLESIKYRVTSIAELKVIISHFEKYPLLTNKRADFELFKIAARLVEQGAHLTKDGLERLLSIKATLNRGLSDNLKAAFPGIKPVPRPNNPNNTISNLFWLAGFTDAEGCFFVVIKKSPKSRLGESVWFKFILTQHSRDESLIKSIITILGCGRYIPRSKKEYGEFVVEKFSDILEKIIPFFEKYSLQGIKYQNFSDFKAVAALMQNRSHLTLEGLEEIRKIKSGMNSQRQHPSLLSEEPEEI